MKKQNLEEMTVAELKDMIKASAKEGKVELPTGMWKMTRPQLIKFIEDNTEEEESENNAPETTTTEVETDGSVDNTVVKHVSYDEEDKRGGGSKKKVKMTSENEVLIFDKIDDAHKWLKANHDLGYYHIKKGLEGTQTRKLASINIKFEKVED